MLLSNKIVYFDTENKILTDKKNKYTIKTDIQLTEDLVIPDEINGIPVEQLDARLFEYLLFKTIKLGNNLKKISEDCFYYSQLTELIIPKSVEYLENACFRKSTLIKLTFESDSQLKKIGCYCFENSQLEKLIFENTSELKEIDNYCFLNSKLKELRLPKSIEYIGSLCFYFSPLKKLTFESGSKLKKIDSYCFKNSQLTELIIPKSVEFLGTSCFYSSPLEKLVFESDSNLSKIFRFCFYESKLTKLTIPKSVEYIGDSCFNDSPLINLIFENKNIKLDDNCFYRTELKEIPSINQKELSNIFNNSPFLFID